MSSKDPISNENLISNQIRLLDQNIISNNNSSSPRLKPIILKVNKLIEQSPETLGTKKSSFKDSSVTNKIKSTFQSGAPVSRSNTPESILKQPNLKHLKLYSKVSSKINNPSQDGLFINTFQFPELHNLQNDNSNLTLDTIYTVNNHFNRLNTHQKEQITEVSKQNENIDTNLNLKEIQEKNNYKSDNNLGIGDKSIKLLNESKEEKYLKPLSNILNKPDSRDSEYSEQNTDSIIIEKLSSISNIKNSFLIQNEHSQYENAFFNHKKQTLPSIPKISSEETYSSKSSFITDLENLNNYKPTDTSPKLQSQDQNENAYVHLSEDHKEITKSNSFKNFKEDENLIDLRSESDSPNGDSPKIKATYSGKIDDVQKSDKVDKIYLSLIPEKNSKTETFSSDKSDNNKKDQIPHSIKEKASKNSEPHTNTKIPLRIKIKVQPLTQNTTDNVVIRSPKYDQRHDLTNSLKLTENVPLEKPKNRSPVYLPSDDNKKTRIIKDNKMLKAEKKLVKNKNTKTSKNNKVTKKTKQPTKLNKTIELKEPIGTRARIKAKKLEAEEVMQINKNNHKVGSEDAEKYRSLKNRKIQEILGLDNRHLKEKQNSHELIEFNKPNNIESKPRPRSIEITSLLQNASKEFIPNLEPLFATKKRNRQSLNEINTVILQESAKRFKNDFNALSTNQEIRPLSKEEINYDGEINTEGFNFKKNKEIVTHTQHKRSLSKNELKHTDEINTDAFDFNFRVVSKPRYEKINTNSNYFSGKISGFGGPDNLSNGHGASVSLFTPTSEIIPTDFSTPKHEIFTNINTLNSNLITESNESNGITFTTSKGKLSAIPFLNSRKIISNYSATENLTKHNFSSDIGQVENVAESNTLRNDDKVNETGVILPISAKLNVFSQATLNQNKKTSNVKLKNNALHTSANNENTKKDKITNEPTNRKIILNLKPKTQQPKEAANSQLEDELKIPNKSLEISNQNLFENSNKKSPTQIQIMNQLSILSRIERAPQKETLNLNSTQNEKVSSNSFSKSKPIENNKRKNKKPDVVISHVLRSDTKSKLLDGISMDSKRGKKKMFNSTANSLANVNSMNDEIMDSEHIISMQTLSKKDKKGTSKTDKNNIDIGLRTEVSQGVLSGKEMSTLNSNNRLPIKEKNKKSFPSTSNIFFNSDLFPDKNIIREENKEYFNAIGNNSVNNASNDHLLVKKFSDHFHDDESEELEKEDNSAHCILM